MTTVIVKSYKPKIDDHGNLSIRFYFNPTEIAHTTKDKWSIKETGTIGVGSIVTFEVRYGTQINITDVTKANEPVDLTVCPFCGFKVQNMKCLNGFCKGVVKQKLKLLNSYWHMFDKQIIISYNVFNHIDRIKGNGYIRDKLLHSTFSQIDNIFDTFTDNDEMEKDYILNRYDLFIELLKKQQRNRMSKMLLEHLEVDV